VQSKTGGKPVYRYLYARPRPTDEDLKWASARAGLAGGVIKDTSANKAALRCHRPAVQFTRPEIEYALGNLPTNRVYDWQPEDYKVSEIMQALFANFIKTGNPNGLGVPEWPAVDNNKGVQVMHINVDTKAIEDKNGKRYLFMDKNGEKMTS
jgi:para-nitrobenzyl esterase